jgi:DNA-3-methyladenine glycosylase II
VQRQNESWSLETRAPFHLEATVRVLQRRPTNVVDRWERDAYVRVLATNKGLALVEVVNHGTIDEPDIRFHIPKGDRSNVSRKVMHKTLRRVLGLDVDPAPLQDLAEAERRLIDVAHALRGMRPPRFAELFETFANVVPFQQVSLDAGVAIVGQLVERFGNVLEHDGRRFHAFPAPEVIADTRIDGLRRCGLSLRKAQTLRDIARAIAASELSEEKLTRMSSVEAENVLTELPGIGPWSAGLVLLRGLGRLDVFPLGDVGATRGLSALMHLPSGSSLDRVIQRFGDHRGYLYFCSLGRSLLAKSLIRPAPSHR